MWNFRIRRDEKRFRQVFVFCHDDHKQSRYVDLIINENRRSLLYLAEICNRVSNGIFLPESFSLLPSVGQCLVACSCRVDLQLFWHPYVINYVAKNETES